MFSSRQSPTATTFKWISTIFPVKESLTFDYGHSYTVSIPCNSLDDLLEKKEIFWGVQRPKVERVHEGYRASSHGDDIPDNAPYTGSSPIVRVYI